MVIDRTGDEVLIEGLKNGSMESLRAIYEKYKGALYGYLYHLLGNHEAAEDCIQDVFVHLFERAKQYKAGTRFSSWLYQMAKNMAYDLMRKNKVRRAVSLDREIESEEGATSIANLIASDVDTEKTILSNEQEALLRKTILMLGETDRELITLCDLQEMSYREAGEVLGYSEDVISTMLYRARKRLAKLLKLED